MLTTDWSVALGPAQGTEKVNIIVRSQVQKNDLHLENPVPGKDVNRERECVGALAGDVEMCCELIFRPLCSPG